MAIGPPRLLHPACARKQAEASHKSHGTSHCTRCEQEAPLEEEKERKERKWIDACTALARASGLGDAGHGEAGGWCRSMEE